MLRGTHAITSSSQMVMYSLWCTTVAYRPRALHVVSSGSPKWSSTGPQFVPCEKSGESLRTTDADSKRVWQQSLRCQMLTTLMSYTLPRSTCHHSVSPFCVCVHVPPPQMELRSPSTARFGSPSHPIEDCVHGFWPATLLKTVPGGAGEGGGGGTDGGEPGGGGGGGGGGTWGPTAMTSSSHIVMYSL